MVRIIYDTSSVASELFSAYSDRETVTVLSEYNIKERALFESYGGDPALITWTSGTSGHIKGVVIPWDAVAARCAALHNWYASKGYMPLFNSLCTLLAPGNSGGAISSIMFANLYAGKLTRTLEDASVITLTPFQLRKLIAQGHVEAFTNLQLIVTIGQELNLATRTQAETVLGVPVVEIYACSEAGAIAMNGEVVPGLEVQTESKFIHVKGQTIASGYLGGLPFPLRADGWLNTHDMGRLADRKLEVLGRKL